MEEKRYCDVHTEHTSRIRRSEADIQEIWKAIDHMRGFVIGGMCAVIIQVVIFVFNRV